MSAPLPLRPHLPAASRLQRRGRESTMPGRRLQLRGSLERRFPELHSSVRAIDELELRALRFTLLHGALPRESGIRTIRQRGIDLPTDPRQFTG